MLHNRGMDTAGNTLRRFAQAAGEVVAETLWPTRCVLCERPGAVLCNRCAHGLAYLDWWRACPRCGAEFGCVQCTSCDEVTLARLGRDALPYDGCAAATVFDDSTGRIVRAFKDHGERRLADDMAGCLLRCLPPAWEFDAIAYIPSTLAAYRYRGFDHAKLLAGRFAAKLDVGCALSPEDIHPCSSLSSSVPQLIDAFARPESRDQRKLSRSQRFRNMAGRFRADPRACAGKAILVIDDVSTTGATLFEASDALREAGASCVYCMTFARV